MMSPEKESIKAMDLGASGIRRIEKSLTRMRRVVHKEIRIFIGLLDARITTPERAIKLGCKDVESCHTQSD